MKIPIHGYRYPYPNAMLPLNTKDQSIYQKRLANGAYNRGGSPSLGWALDGSITI